ncbi:MAG: osmoprotectant NAGGN system M42 family peptidase [Alphaproteobacteria bacterium CG11_big_fil_rev_8_21_14_0_20_39_49]|nr:MAG: osmoprotectant NAGGN system M42 family peptidase [Alphaproteobacteria bacterium CG11_big_fil_rev_8_21_14_0_20_39_49]
MKKIPIDKDYITDTLVKMLKIPSPTGFTDEIVHFVGGQLDNIGVPFELTRRGAIRANLEGKKRSPDRAIVCHLDTLGAMVKGLKSNGRLEITRIGHWCARVAEGARVTLFTDNNRYRGTILPLKASGHTFADEIDKQPSGWEYIELRLDEKCHNKEDLQALGINVGDYIAIDTNTEITENGFINSRHLDNKAGVAVQLATIKAIIDSGVTIPVDCHPLFTISEEEGSGASSILHGDVASMVTIDNSTVAPGQNSSEYGVTIAMRDMSGVFDYHLTHKLIELCQKNKIEHSRDVFKYYRSDSASAIESGNDIRTALVCFALDASHAWERTHIDSLMALTELLTLYIQSPTDLVRDKDELGSLKGFTHQG